MRLRMAVAALTVVGAAIAGVAGTASASPVTGTEHFLILQTGTSQVPSVTASGPIHAAGRDIVVSDNRDRFVFPKGTLIVDHHAVSSHDSFDPKTCLGRATETGTYRIVRGTHAYSGASGHGTYHVKVLIQGCNQNRPPKQFLLEIHASGPLTLP